MSFAVITVTELATCSIGVTIAVGLTTTCPLFTVGAGLASLGGCCVGAGTARRETGARSVGGSTLVLFGSGGGRTSMAGSKSGDADCCALAADMPKETMGIRKLEASKQLRRRFAAVLMEDMVRPRYDVSGTSQRTKSHRCAFQHPCEANVCTPRPTSSRVTTADGRSPGSRVITLRRLPRTEIPSGI
jgi:hypothetical protein